MHLRLAQIESGAQPHDNNVLKHAPHAQSVLLSEKWDRPYTRAKAAYPVPGLRQEKFWPTTSRVNDTCALYIYLHTYIHI